MKRALVFLLIFLLCACAYADTYCDTSSRINYFYQLDGGNTDEEGTYDKLLVPVIREITNGAHTSIVPWDNLYLTGRGCDLFSFGHAYQYLTGYKSGYQGRADALAVFLRGIPGQPHIWNTNNPLSTLNPPKACSYYAATLAKQSGVKKYSGSTGTFSGLCTLFAGCRGVCIVNVGGHYVIAVGCTMHDGVGYVLIVDSIMSATLRKNRCGYGYSFDFSTRYDDTNAKQLEPTVHQYWLPYSKFAKCSVNYAFYVGEAPHNYIIQSPYKKGAAVITGETLDLEVYEWNGYTDAFLYESADEAVATVDENGILTAVGPGQTTVNCYSEENPYQMLTIPVYVGEWVHPGCAFFMEDETYPELLTGCTLPKDISIKWTEDGFATLADDYGNVFSSVPYTVISADDAYMHLSRAVSSIEANAFNGAPLRCILIDNPDIAISPDAFDEETEVFFRIEDGWYEKQ